MKFTCTTEINLPIHKVIELFDNVDNLKKWQKGLVSFEHISGNAGEPGAKSKIIFNTDKHVIELIETILIRDLPKEMSALYEHKHMVNTMTNRFYEMDKNRTIYEAEINYSKFIGFIPKMMALLMPGMFKRQVQEMLDNFKTFAEQS